MKRRCRSYDVVGELTESYRVFDLADGGALVLILVPKEFKEVFLIKMTEMSVTQDEIDEFRSDSSQPKERNG